MPLVLAFTIDGALSAAVQEVAATLYGCRFLAVGRFQDLADRRSDDSVRLLIVHPQNDTPQDAIDDCLRQWTSRRPEVPILLIRDGVDSRRDLHYLRLGVRDCLPRPLDLKRLGYLIDSLTLKARLEESYHAKSEEASPIEQAMQMAASPMRLVLKQAQRVALRDVPVLLGGETGTGKTYLAKLIHGASPRKDRPFIRVNCAALPVTLIESELFGHQRGAFTGADGDREGKLSHAGEGTLFLDDIDALPLDCQAKLLRVLDEKLFERVGSNVSLPFQARLIAASNQSLEASIATDQFRADLYYRLSVIQLDLPPLRDRREEITPLAEAFLNDVSRMHQLPRPILSEAAMRQLTEYRWPGNIRELHNTIEYAVALCEGEFVEVEDLPAKLRGTLAPAEALRVAQAIDAQASAAPQSLAQARLEGECRRLLDVLKQCGNNRTQAAKALGISRTALYKRLCRFGIT